MIRLKNKLILLFIGLLYSFVTALAQEEESQQKIILSDSSKISLLIASSGEEDVWTVFGHAGVRVLDPVNSIDYTFNYGIFSFSNNFIYRFVKGETDYRVLTYDTSSYLNEYLSVGRKVTELTIDLRNNERQAFWEYLLWNIKPENATYRYNFLYDNCSTRPIDIILKVTKGHFILPKVEQKKSWRELINYAERHKPWLMLGTDLALGSANDSIPTLRETFFLPSYVVRYLPKTRLERPDGSMLSVVSNIKEYLPVHNQLLHKDLFDNILSPNYIFILFILVSAFMLKRSLTGRSISLIWEALLDILFGLTGCILFFLTLFSYHPHTGANYNLWVLNPIYIIIGLPLLLFARKRKLYIWYHFLIFVALVLWLLFSYLLPQHFNTSVYLIALVLLLQSLAVLTRILRSRLNL